MLWLKSENATIGSGYVVRWKTMANTFEISSSRDGVMLQGATSAMEPDEITEVISQIRTAAVIAGRLRADRYERDDRARRPFPAFDFKGHPVRTGECVDRH